MSSLPMAKLEQLEYQNFLISEYEDFLVSKSNHTKRAYLRDIFSFVTWLSRSGKQSVKQIDSKDIRRFLAYNQQLGKSSSSQSRISSALRSYFNFLFKNKYIAQDLANTISSRKVTSKLPRVPSQKQMEKLLTQIAEEYYNAEEDSQIDEKHKSLYFQNWLILELLYGGGFRVSELCSLTLNNFRWNKNDCIVLGKGNKERVIPLSLEVMKMVQIFIQEHRKNLQDKSKLNSYLLLTSTGKPLSTRDAYRIVERYSLPDSGIKLHPHQLRHAYATHVLEGGADVRIVQELLGHSSCVTTQRYTQITQKKLTEEYKRTHPRG